MIFQNLQEVLMMLNFFFISSRSKKKRYLISIPKCILQIIKKSISWKKTEMRYDWEVNMRVFVITFVLPLHRDKC